MSIHGDRELVMVATRDLHLSPTECYPAGMPLTAEQVGRICKRFGMSAVRFARKNVSQAVPALAMEK